MKTQAEILIKHVTKQPKKFGGEWQERCYPISAITEAMDEYAGQYKKLLEAIIEAKDKALNTEDLFAVLQEIEKARNVLAVTA